MCISADIPMSLSTTQSTDSADSQTLNTAKSTHTLVKRCCRRSRGSSPQFQMDTGQIMMRSSSITLSTRKMMYSRNIVAPRILFIFHLQVPMEMMTKRSMRKSSTMAQKSPLLLTCTGAIPWLSENRSHGTGRLFFFFFKEHKQRSRERQKNKCIRCLYIFYQF